MSGMRVGPVRRFLEGRQGTTSIEFAAVSVPFFLMVFGLFGFGYVGYLDNDLKHAANNVQRFVLVKHVTDKAMIAEFVRKDFLGDDDNLDIQVYETVSGGRRFLNVDLAFVIAFPGPIEVLREGMRLEHKRMIPL
ncbi:TadE/TadG family type IV pilus assembly protein [Aurantimonas sp. C2-6-R+9]|uniref:TadE/TadG family type IV pilus assembly protein n=1 Tax=unclassified Aurantimonas TaxID=2638230 RepID=UPI002E180AE1|nr:MULTISPECIES: TadE/TadG family type IV pilus assembly protein [unclassified Aurantimonas]MEC5290126.1 TadE/TadG family type IV pilus assembly protein [Aurantimonas sp. C2-3-R2]MEC5380239.1 TadE/TadG family type IV pilus assembly protein [Aurantimonas sp. C2-6-R+9]MEC5411190.1 TadE/TadG family type IV pilus assembly protein [Aurantimonas sp. C2-4-R8]